MQKIVGGYIELVRVFSRHGAVLFVNEEGIPLGLPLNKVATDVAGKPIYGDALLVHPNHLTD